MDLMEIKQIEDKKFSIQVRSHKIVVDMRKEDGGQDSGMNPIELLTGALGACMGMTIQIYCKMHNVPCEGIVVNAVPAMALNPKRVENIAVDIALPPGFPSEKKESIFRIVNSCPVHHAFTHPPQIDVDVVS